MKVSSAMSGDSSSPKWVQCPCNNCSGNLEFDPSHAGETIQCPHCKLDTVLFIPNDAKKPPAETPPPKPESKIAKIVERPLLEEARDLIGSPAPPAPPASAAPVGVSGNSGIKHVLTIFLAITGLAMLVTGYTAPARAERNVVMARFNRVCLKEWDAKIHESDPSYREHALVENKQLKPFEDLTDFLEENSYKTRGAIQYCTGWLLIAAACVVFMLGQNEKCNVSNL